MALSLSEEFPLAGKLTYLTTAGMGLVPKSALDATISLYHRHLKAFPYPDLFDEFQEYVENGRRTFAPWIGARGEEVSFQPSASAGLNSAISMVAPKRGDNVVVDDLGFPSGTFPAINLHKKGVQVKWTKNKGGMIRAEDYEDAIDDKTKLVIVSLVSWVNGLRADVEEIIKMAHEKGALCLVDSTHGTGYIDIDAGGWKLDFLATSNYKWLLSTHGAAEFFCARNLLQKFDPPQLGWHSSPVGQSGLRADEFELAVTARRFEPGNPDYISIRTLTKSLAVMSRFGRRKITDKTLKLSMMVNEGLRSLGMSVLTPDDKKHLSGITFAYSKRISGDQLQDRLRKSKILVTSRSYRKKSGIRVSPYFYNEEEDIDTFLSAVKKLV